MVASSRKASAGIACRSGPNDDQGQHQRGARDGLHRVRGRGDVTDSTVVAGGDLCGQRLRPTLITVADRHRRAWQQVCHDGQVAARLHAGADDGHRPGIGGTPARDGYAADGRRPQRGDAAGIEDPQRQAGDRVADDGRGRDGRESAAGVLREADHPLHAQQIVTGVGGGSAHPGGHGVGEGVGRRGVDADLRWQLGIVYEGEHGGLGEAKALSRRQAPLPAHRQR